MFDSLAPLEAACEPPLRVIIEPKRATSIESESVCVAPSMLLTTITPPEWKL